LRNRYRELPFIGELPGLERNHDSKRIDSL
jgi:hypothetical protein